MGMTESMSQEAVFALLADPATHGGAEVKRIDTHAASVFLAGNRTFKVKRAVRFPFLDYSTLDKRKAACEAELRLNGAEQNLARLEDVYTKNDPHDPPITTGRVDGG